MPSHRLPRCACACLTIVVAAFAGHAAQAKPRGGAGCSLAITHVNVIPMDVERVLPDQTVTLGGGRVISIKPAARADAKNCAKIIDAHGGYLVPGLNDMHVHVETLAFAQAFGIKAAPIDYPSELASFVAYNGVTGILRRCPALPISWPSSGQPEGTAFGPIRGWWSPRRCWPATRRCCQSR